MPSTIEFFISAQHDNGGWGYLAGRKPVVEPTAAVLLALRTEPLARDSFKRGMTWLLNCQHQDGGWGINEVDPESGWQTAWVLIVLKYTGQNKEQILKAEGWLKSVGTLEFTPEQFLNSTTPENGQLISLVWPWLPGEAGWVEPTALAVLALADVSATPGVASRIQSALDYFRQYRTPEGGWNIGNTTSLDTTVIPRAYPTSLVLLALSQVAQQVIQSDDTSALQQDMNHDPGILAKSAGLLALRSLGLHNETISTYLVDHLLPDGSWDHNPFSTAWASMALRGYL